MIARIFTVALFAAIVLNSASAQDNPGQEAPAGPAGTAAGEPTHFAITGLAVDDLLNLRATASPIGMLIGRLPQGTLVANLGCAEVKEVRWCKVADLDNDKIQGWAAARYLQPAEPPPVDDIGPVGDTLDEPAVEEPAQQ